MYSLIYLSHVVNHYQYEQPFNLLLREETFLIEPSIIMLAKLIRSNTSIFEELKNKKVILNQSLLLNSDISDFEHEAGVSIFYNMPALDERKRNGNINDFLSKLGLFNTTVRDTGGSKIFGLFRR